MNKRNKKNSGAGEPLPENAPKSPKNSGNSVADPSGKESATADGAVEGRDLESAPSDSENSDNGVADPSDEENATADGVAGGRDSESASSDSENSNSESALNDPENPNAESAPSGPETPDGGAGSAPGEGAPAEGEAGPAEGPCDNSPGAAAAAKKPRRPVSRRRRALEYAALALCAVVFVYSATQIIQIEQERGEAASEYRELTEEDAPLVVDTPPQERVIDFGSLTAKNSDVVGWVYIPRTAVDLPIVRGEDNEFYLTHSFLKRENKLGAIFMDMNTSRDWSDKNSVVHGHNIKNGSMFAALVSYRSADFYSEHPDIILFTPTGNYRLAVFAAFVVGPAEPYLPHDFEGDEAFMAFVEAAVERSPVKMGVAVQPGDQIVSFSTCAYDYDDARFVVYAVKLPLEGQVLEESPSSIAAPASSASPTASAPPSSNSRP